jgi:hypothetical protein
MPSKTKKITKKIAHYWHQKFALPSSVMLFAVSVSWFGDSFPIQKWEEHNFISGLIAFILMLSATWLFNASKSSLCEVNILDEKEFQPHKAVVTLLSELPPQFIKELQTATKDLEADIQKGGLMSRLNWRQQLRMLAKNTDLETIYVISSQEKSCKQLGIYIELINNYRENVRVVPIMEEGIDFENLKQVTKAIQKAINEATKIYDKTEIAIDITGGQKTASIAAANYTLQHRELEFFYVAQDENEQTKIISYNAISNKSEAPA